MTLINQRAKKTSPHARGEHRTGQVMVLVAMAAIPGLIAQTLFFGWGTLINVIGCSLIALSCEALVLSIRKRPLAFYLSDGSALVTGLLIGLAVPPLAPFWLTLIGVSFAIIIGKHL